MYRLDYIVTARSRSRTCEFVYGFIKIQRPLDDFFLSRNKIQIKKGDSIPKRPWDYFFPFQRGFFEQNGRFFEQKWEQIKKRWSFFEQNG
jgi:hypothetical protein